MAPMIRNPNVIVSPAVKAEYGTVKVTVYRDARGDIYIREKGARLTPAEKRKKLSPAHGQTARALKQFYENPENLNYKIKFTKQGAGIMRTQYLRPATIDGRAGWFDVRNGKFLFKEQRSKDKPNQWGEYYKQYGTMQLNLRSVDSTSYGLTQRGSLEDFYLNWLNSKEKSRLNEALNALDWENEVYQHFKSSDPDESAPAGRPNYDEEKKGYDAVLRVIKKTVGAKWAEYELSLGGA